MYAQVHTLTYAHSSTVGNRDLFLRKGDVSQEHTILPHINLKASALACLAPQDTKVTRLTRVGHCLNDPCRIAIFQLVAGGVLADCCVKSRRCAE